MDLNSLGPANGSNVWPRGENIGCRDHLIEMRTLSCSLPFHNYTLWRVVFRHEKLLINDKVLIHKVGNFGSILLAPANWQIYRLGASEVKPSFSLLFWWGLYGYLHHDRTVIYFSKSNCPSIWSIGRKPFSNHHLIWAISVVGPWKKWTWTPTTARILSCF